MSGTSGNEEEMAEEAEGEAGRGLWWGDTLSSPGFPAQLWHRSWDHGLSGAAHVSTGEGGVGGSCLSPQSHAKVMASCSTKHSWRFGGLWLSHLQGLPWITALLPGLSGGCLFWEGCTVRELCYQPASAMAAGCRGGPGGAQGGCQQPPWPGHSSASASRLHIKSLPGAGGCPGGFSSPWRRASPLVSNSHQRPLFAAPTSPGPGNLMHCWKPCFVVLSPKWGGLCMLGRVRCYLPLQALEELSTGSKRFSFPSTLP